MADAKRKRRSPTQVAKRAKLVVLPLTMVPLAVALVRYFTDQFGVDAIGDFTLDTGNWGIRLLLVTLAVHAGARVDRLELAHYLSPATRSGGVLLSVRASAGLRVPGLQAEPGVHPHRCHRVAVHYRGGGFVTAADPAGDHLYYRLDPRPGQALGGCCTGWCIPRSSLGWCITSCRSRK